MSVPASLWRDASLGPDDVGGYRDCIESAAAAAGEAFVKAYCAVNPAERAYRGTAHGNEWWLSIFRLGDLVAQGHGRTTEAAMADLGRELWRVTGGNLR